MEDNKQNNPLVSVIVPCFNNGEYLAETLDSILGQTYSDWECIIIDDGSTDDSHNVAEKYVQKDTRFKYIYQENKGVSNARNNAIRNSTGKYILPLDGDDKISPGYLKEAIEILESDKSIKLVYCKAETFGNRTGYWDIPPYSYKYLLIENLIFCSAIFRKEDLHGKIWYDEGMSEGFEDWDFWVSFLNETDKVIQIPKVNFYYRVKEITRNPKTTDDEKQKRIRNYIFQKHSALYQKYFSLPDVIFDYYKARGELNSIRNSTSYRLGKMILMPFWSMMKLFK
ncbi:MAG: glycosyltransferase family 2 protein [Bacteroidia bacterium]